MINLEGYVNIRILLSCLLIGFILKMWIEDQENRWIPTVVTVVGVIVSFCLHGISLESGLIGGVSGFASTGMHQLVKQLITSKDKK